MALNDVDSTGVQPCMIGHVEDWRDWLENEDDPRQRFSLSAVYADPRQRFSLSHGYADGEISFCNRRDAEYIVQSLRVGNESHPQKATELCLYGGNASDEAIAIFCEYLQQPTPNLVSLYLGSSFHLTQCRRLLESLHTNTSVKELHMVGHHADVGLSVSEVLRHKTDLTSLKFFGCTFRISDIFPGLRRGHAHLQTLEIVDCAIGDEEVRLLLEGDFPVLKELGLPNINITSVGLRCLAERGPVALQFLKKLELALNRHLLDDLESTGLFVQRILLSDGMALNELHVGYCGKYTPAIIKACESDNSKLQMLFISNFGPLCQAVRDQLIESFPKINKLEHLVCGDSRVFAGDSQPAVMSALRKNTSIVKLTTRFGDAETPETRRLVDPILNRNQCLKQADALLALQPKTQKPIGSKSGLWYMAFAKMASLPSSPATYDTTENGGYPSASAIFKILQKRPDILEKQLRRPAAAAAEGDRGVAQRHQQDAKGNDGDDRGTDSVLHADADAGGRKRRRL